MIRRLTPADRAVAQALRQEALRDTPLAFGSSPADDRWADPASVAEGLAPSAGAAVLGSFRDGALVGMVGLRRLPKAKARHRAELWGMFVRRDARGQGRGAALVAAALDQARVWGVDTVELGVTDADPAAQRLYVRMGFVRWGALPDAVRHGGASASEHFLIHRLRG